MENTKSLVNRNRTHAAIQERVPTASNRATEAEARRPRKRRKRQKASLYSINAQYLFLRGLRSSGPPPVFPAISNPPGSLRKARPSRLAITHRRHLRCNGNNFYRGAEIAGDNEDIAPSRRSDLFSTDKNL
ncbi:Hypothetical protein NTJ_01887 [Nesidiocoris tenuis]|uniref:Uncharacterized protein n=1 Tax=Nesidiocoris tenuis TaxID=355587 RepID=A0ABN7A9U0_9HEMI|nr:Hypothetical protein NTJ_01887 [Nesidiocoris tenuis]